ncbi:pseudouridine synthase [Jeongeupia naejangsanensis]|uniref:Pseudouridylate synthase n=1 Tax=Jeongeupia naejangsanensis TaxID=613195 RepID=A0ABS2BIU4_9NEIS|nr:pseudouridine synthase [Jeongeupia naejangsanensis]MBM3115028.1 pseudouridylate synthase [Jeongeupia naejangsanensis]
MSRETLPELYRDDALIAVHKPSGLLVHRSMIDRHETRFAMQIVRDQIGRRVYPVHRLDKGTSGTLMFALDPDTAKLLTAAFETRAIEKDYLAVVRGWLPEAGTVDHPLTRLVDAYEFAGEASATDAQDAVTDYRRLATIELPVAIDRYPTSRYSLAALAPLTGRRHQLRRHLKHLSHPIIGDATYGKGRHNRMFAERFGVGRMLLACTGLRLAHPHTGAALDLACPLAADMQGVIDALGWANAPHRR